MHAGVNHTMYDEVVTLRIRTPPPDEVMDERHMRRKQPCLTRCFSSMDKAFAVFCIVVSVSITVFSLVILWTSLYTKIG